jgi:predicted DNA-binding transcriptional regulator YafY
MIEWNTFGFKTGRAIYAEEDEKTGNVIFARYKDNNQELTEDEIELELF